VFFSLGFFFLQNKILPLRARCLFLLLLSFSSFFIVFSLGALLRGVARGKKKISAEDRVEVVEKKNILLSYLKKNPKRRCYLFKKQKITFFRTKKRVSLR
jgi:hypothetical protein